MSELGYGFPSDSGIPVGVILPFFGGDSDVPNGWLLCDGRKFPVGKYAALAAQLSRAAGAYMDTTPDLRGRVPIGKDNMGGTAANRVTGSWADSFGGASGQEAATMPAHTHQLMLNDTHSGGAGTMRAISRYSSNTASGENGYTARTTTSVEEVLAFAENNKTGYTPVNVSTASAVADNMQPSMAMNYIIKAA